VEEEGNYEGSGVQGKKVKNEVLEKGVGDVIENERQINLKCEE
jgi:hypothetical protein